MSDTRDITYAEVEVRAAIAGVLADLLQARLGMPLEDGISDAAIMNAVDRLAAEEEPAVELLCRAAHEAFEHAHEALSALERADEETTAGTLAADELIFVERVLYKVWWRFGWRTGRDVPDWIKKAALSDEEDIRKSLVSEGLSALSAWYRDPDLSLRRIFHPMTWWEERRTWSK